MKYFTVIRFYSFGFPVISPGVVRSLIGGIYPCFALASIGIISFVRPLFAGKISGRHGVENLMVMLGSFGLRLLYSAVQSQSSLSVVRPRREHGKSPQFSPVPRLFGRASPCFGRASPCKCGSAKPGGYLGVISHLSPIHSVAFPLRFLAVLFPCQFPVKPYRNLTVIRASSPAVLSYLCHTHSYFIRASNPLIGGRSAAVQLQVVIPLFNHGGTTEEQRNRPQFSGRC